MKRRTFTLLAMLFAATFVAAQGDVRSDSLRRSLRDRRTVTNSRDVTADTIEARYPVAELLPSTIDDTKQLPMDLKSPSNIITDTLYNDKDTTYLISTRLGNPAWSTHTAETRGVCQVAGALNDEQLFQEEEL